MGLGTEEKPMEQKFVSFDEAVEKLGITPERLNDLREDGQLRAYRDGKSWKFRSDEIESMVEGGVPEPAPPSDIGLVDPADLVAAAPIEIEEDVDELKLVLEEIESSEAQPEAPESSDLDLELKLDDTDAVPAGGSELEGNDLEDTVTAGASDIALDDESKEPSPSDSILLSEETLGESVTGSPSTIIGKSKLSSADDDLELSLSDESKDKDDIEGSDVKLAPSSGASDVLSSQVAGSGVLDELEKETGGTSAFKDLDELEIDLAAESSPALETGKKETSAEETDLGLMSSGSLELDLGDESAESTEVPVLEVEESLAGSEIGLAGDEDDIVLEDSSGSDLTLDSGDSGINLSPADSGLALDDIPLEMGGSAILSSLSLEGSDPEISLLGSGAGSGDQPVADLQTDDDFQLTPMSESDEAEGDSSSQVIALDEGMEDFADAEVLDEAAFAEEEGDVVLSEDFGEAPAGDLEMGYAPVAATAAAPGVNYTAGNVILLGSAVLLLSLGGVMMLDMMRYIWSWDEPYTLNSAVMDAILGLFG